MMATEISNLGELADQYADRGYVEVLSDVRDGRPFGLRVGGIRPGPTAVVAGYSPIARDIYGRLLELPSLSRLRGSLVLITLDALDVTSIDEKLVEQIGPVDRTLHLPFPSGEERETAVRQGYWTVLKLCAQLGMISGRGVSMPS
ncbi:hypothetical protein DEA8626_04016 [Defluviimonas aquaemixtae]|uniref:Uncharacterized protein n=1 Tax=Albidovulum aquaemixtae TaxID=1542388 RepID=A0A2R8BNN4_9RHOB|nr:hypothetical protein [Defluviimonas aquaemixtae]SPH24984.1 hypothetical protein DEA8626_04016 [Defluviimonas aquaemixtae]